MRSMITVGVDVGVKMVKVVAVEDGRIISKGMVPAGLDTRQLTSDLYNDLLAKSGLDASKVSRVVSTGVGRRLVEFASADVTEVTADAKAASHMFPTARTVIDIGAEEGRGIRLTDSGRVSDFVTNEKCAAGAGSFIEAMARALEVTPARLGELSFSSTKDVPMNAQCAVFAESEVVSLIHANTSKEDIAKAVLDAIATRIVSMVARIGVEKDIVLMGGLARNDGFISAVRRGLGSEVIVPEGPEYLGALGAALIAAEQAQQEVG